MRITFEYYLDADYDQFKDDYSEYVAEDVEKYGDYFEEEYDDAKKAEYSWNLACKSYRYGDSAYHISYVSVVTDDDKHTTIDIDDLFSDFDFQDVMGAAKDALSNGWEDASLCDYVNSRD